MKLTGLRGKMKTIAVTGSSGFLGKHLVNDLNKHELNVIELDINKGFDLTNINDINQVPKFDIIIHLAAKSYVPHSFERPHEYYRDNFLMTLNMLELARLHKAKLIYISSYLYGNPKYLPINEKHPIQPHNPYAQSKLLCEKLCEGYSRDFDVPIIIFRPFNIYGPGQDVRFLIPSIISQIKNGNVTLNDPRPKRDFVYVKDVTSAILKAIDNKGLRYEILNIGSGISHSVASIIEILNSQFENKINVQFKNEFRKTEVLDTIADISKIENILNWRPSTKFKEGLLETFHNYNF